MFEHKLLDGEKYRLITVSEDFVKPEVLEIRDPKSDTPLEKTCRYQYGVIEEVLVERYLPPESTGDSWAHDGVAAPWWSVVGHPPHGGIVADFNKHTGGAYHRTLNPDNNVVAYAEAGEAVTFDGSEYIVTRGSDNTELRGNRIVALRQLYYA